MPAIGSGFALPIYDTLSTKKKYLCKNDILLFIIRYFDKMSKKYNKPLSLETKKVLDSYAKALAGTCEFVLSSEWDSALNELEASITRIRMELSFYQGIGFDGSIMTQALEKVMEKFPEVLLPYKKENKLKVVRLFKNSRYCFAMADELKNAVNETPCKKDSMDFLDTVSPQAVLEASKENNFEILVSNVRVYVALTPTGSNCMLSVIALLQLMIFVTRHKNILNQKFAIGQKLLEKFSSVIGKNFSYDKKHPFFITEERYSQISKTIKEIFEGIEQLETETRSQDRKVAYLRGLFPEFMEFFHNQNGCHLFKVNRCPQCPVKPTIDFEQDAMEMLIELEKTANTSAIQLLDSEPTSFEEHTDSKETATVAKKKKRKNKNKKASDTQKISETADDALGEQDVTALVPEVPETPKSSANPLEKLDTEPEDLPPKAECQKCFRTSEYCEEAKEQLKLAQNSVKKLEKKQSETQKLMEEMKKKWQEEMDALKLQMEVMKKTNEKQMEELKNTNEQQLLEKEKEIEQLREENSKLMERVKEEPEPTESKPSTPAEPPMSQEERLKMILDLEEKIEMQSGEFLKEVDMKVSRLVKAKPEVQRMAHSEHMDFKVQHENYQKACETALNAILINSELTRSQVPALPDYPALSDRFNEEYQKMLEENECVICTEFMDNTKHEELFTCPVCRNHVHSECIDKWFKTSQTCPSCRAAWK